MIRPTKATADGRAYLELQNLARKERKVTGELLTMYVVERWLARLAISAYRDDFILKGGMLLASFGARRPTADADALARNMAADEQTVVQRVVDIALIAMPETACGSTPTASEPSRSEKRRCTPGLASGWTRTWRPPTSGCRWTSTSATR